MATHSVPQSLPPFLNQDKLRLHEKFTDLEWHQRDRLSMALQTSSSGKPSKYTRLSGEGITARNRYLNVEPFASNRIKLRGANLNGAPKDYINASPIILGSRRYIATQGPKETGVGHFYRMLASETKNPAVVVMLTQTHEGGKEKCFQYFPLSDSSNPVNGAGGGGSGGSGGSGGAGGSGKIIRVLKDEEMGDAFEGEVELISVREDSKSRSQVRHLKLRTRHDTHGEEDGGLVEKDIHHILFSGWPDFLVPEGEDRAALLELIRLSAEFGCPPSSSRSSGESRATEEEAEASREIAECLAQTDQSNPRIVHCSAGVGRSGTFIALDYLLSKLHAGEFDGEGGGDPEYDPICELVDEMRCQRMMMVQGEPQFMFLYEVMREQFLERIKAHHGQAVTGAEREGGQGS